MNKKLALCILSGGMDSAVATAIAKSQGYEILALHFDYNQRTQEREKECFKMLCKDFGALKSCIFDANFIAQIGGGALTDTSLNIPKNALEILNTNAYESKNSIDAQSQQTSNKNALESLPITYVPFRNGIFLSIAAALAQRERAEAIFLGIVEEDSSGYPDCSEDFANKAQDFISCGSGENIKICAPLVHKNKSQIVSLGLSLGVDFSHTYSCYENNQKPCKACDSCLLRARGFAMAKAKDPILE